MPSRCRQCLAGCAVACPCVACLALPGRFMLMCCPALQFCCDAGSLRTASRTGAGTRSGSTSCASTPTGEPWEHRSCQGGPGWTTCCGGGRARGRPAAKCARRSTQPGRSSSRRLDKPSDDLASMWTNPAVSAALLTLLPPPAGLGYYLWHPAGLLIGTGRDPYQPLRSTCKCGSCSCPAGAAQTHICHAAAVVQQGEGSSAVEAKLEAMQVRGKSADMPRRAPLQN